jgi:hypothetical protein
MRKTLIIATVLAALVLVPVASARYAEPSPAAGEQGTVALTLAQSQAVSFTTTTTTKLLASGCKLVVKKITAEAFGSIDLWWIRQRLAWCWGPQSNEPVPGPVVQVIKSGPWWTPRCKGRSYGITSAGFNWEWKGWVDCKAAGGVGQRYVKRWTKGHFQLCNPVAGCIQNGFPYAWVRGNAGGSYSKGGGGVG